MNDFLTADGWWDEGIEDQNVKNVVSLFCGDQCRSLQGIAVAYLCSQLWRRRSVGRFWFV